MHSRVGGSWYLDLDGHGHVGDNLAGEGHDEEAHDLNQRQRRARSVRHLNAYYRWRRQCLLGGRP